MADIHRAYEALQEKVHRLEELEAFHRRTLADILAFSTRLTRNTDLASLYRDSNELARVILGLDCSTLMLLSDDGRSLVVRDTIGFPESMIGTFALVEGQGLSSLVVTEKRAAVVEDFRGEDRFAVPDVVFRYGLTSAVSVPMLIGDTVFGVMIGHTRAKRRFTANEIDLYQSLANQAAVAIKNVMHCQSLEESERRFRTLIDRAGDAIFVADLSGRLVEVNERACQSLGYSREELLAMTVVDVDPQAGAERHQEDLWAGLSVDRYATITSRHRRKDGSFLPVEIRIGLLPLHGTNFILGFARDISARKEAEERLAVTFRSIGEGVICTDTAGRVTLINQAAEQMTGWRQEEAKGLPLAQVFTIVDPKSGTPYESPVDRGLATRGLVAVSRQAELIAKDGRRLLIEENSAPIMNGQGQVGGLVLVFRDVTAKRALERERDKVNKIEAIGVLAGGIAHDFNNLLTAILGNVALAANLVPAGDRSQPLLIEAEKATLRARDLTQQLLTFAKGGEPIKQAAQLPEIIRDSAEFVLRGANSACLFDLAADLWLAEVDSGQISQVIQNLVLNASQAMPEGGRIRICGANCRLSAETTLPLTPGNYLRIDIADTGTGIPAHLLDKIFDPYFTTKQRGSGLGLAITHTIVRKHGGYIEARSIQGQGSTFTLYLPAAAAQASADRPAPLAVAAEPPTSASILIMDDEAMVLAVTSQMLAFMGYRAATAVDGRQAVDLYRQALAAGTPYDLLIMDLTVPGGMGGQEAMRELLILDPQVKALVASGYATDPVIVNFRGHGFSGVLVKPFQMAEMKKAIQQALAVATRSAG